VHLRRALLLFAIVLGLAAIAASVSREQRNTEQPSRGVPPPTETTEQTESEATASPRPSLPTAELTFYAYEPQAQRIHAGQAATVYVQVEQPGQVFIHDLGESDPADRLTPARFDILTQRTGRYPITFVAAGADAMEEPAGTLVVVE
jgi:hypothetical protein